MITPKMSKRSNVRIDWCVELDDDSVYTTYEDYLIDAHVEPQEGPYYGNTYDSSYPATGAEIDVVDVWALVDGKYEPVPVREFFESLSRDQQDSVDYLLEEEYNNGLESYELTAHSDSEYEKSNPDDYFNDYDMNDIDMYTFR